MSWSGSPTVRGFPSDGLDRHQSTRSEGLCAGQASRHHRRRGAGFGFQRRTDRLVDVVSLDVSVHLCCVGPRRAGRHRRQPQQGPSLQRLLLFLPGFWPSPGPHCERRIPPRARAHRGDRPEDRGFPSRRYIATPASTTAECHTLKGREAAAWPARRRDSYRGSPQAFLTSILRSALTASGFLAAVTLSTPWSNLASTLASSTVSGRRMARSKLPKLRSAR